MLFMLRDAASVASLDDAVSKYLNDFSIHIPYNTNKQITLRQLASHTSGLPREIPVDWAEMGNYNEAQILSLISQLYTLYAGYSYPHYSNLGMALLGRTLEKATSPSTMYENWVEQNILTALDMNSSGFTYNQSNLAVGLHYNNNGKPVPAYIQNLGWGNPMGGLFSTATDMSKFLMQLFRTNATNGPSQLLDGFTINEMLQGLSLLPDGVNAYGFPYEFAFLQNYWTLSKAGELDGYRSQLAIVPQLKLGVFVSATVDDVPDPTVWTLPTLELLVPVLEALLWKYQPPYYLSPALAAQVVGVYTDTPDSDTLNVTTYGGVLLLSDLSGGGFIGNLTLLPAISSPLNARFLLRAADVWSESCRDSTDGSDHEIVEFVFPTATQRATKLYFMGGTYYYNSNQEKK